MKKIRVLLIFVCTIFITIICNSCNSMNTHHEYVSLRDYYEKLLDSLNKEPNDFIIYYTQNKNIQSDAKIIYTLINYKDGIEISRTDNSTLKTQKYRKNIFLNKIFEDIEKLVDTNVTTSYPQISHFPACYLNLRIKNLVYYYDANIQFYNIPALNYIKAVLFYAENEDSDWK